MPSRKTPTPRIDCIESTGPRGAGKPVSKGRPGDTVRVRGSGFGRLAHRVAVCFDDHAVAPYALPFSDSSLFVTVPPVATPTRGVSVRVGRLVSPALPFAVQPARRRRRSAGAVTGELFAELDAFAAALGAFAHRAAPATGFGDALRRAAAMAEGARATMRRNLDIAMQWSAPQAAIARARLPYEALLTIERMDEAIAEAGLIEQVRGLGASVFGPASALGGLAGDRLADWLFGDGASELAEAVGSIGAAVLDLIGFALTEGAKVLDGIENILKIFVPSASFSASGGIVIAELEVGFDVSFSPGEAVSAFARAVDFIAQIFVKLGEIAAGAEMSGRIDRIEEKLDRQGGAVIELDRKADRQEAKLDRLESKADLASGAIERLEAKADRDGELLGLLETKADRLEAKADRDSELLGLLEAKADRLEAKADAHSAQLGLLESKADRAEEKSDRAELKLDRLEAKADQLEGKADRQEAKLDALEAKGDRAESKLDRLEAKADRGELKLDRLEAKADLAEAKLDRIEEKHDREEVKLDRLVLPVPLEGSIATQQGSGQQLSAAVAATRGQDNAVHLRAAIDRPAARLDEEAAWSGWVSFGRPGGALGLLEVSLDLNYAEGSDLTLSALLSARDQRGNIFHRAFEAGDQAQLLDPARWTDWQSFLAQP